MAYLKRLVNKESINKAFDFSNEMCKLMKPGFEAYALMCGLVVKVTNDTALRESVVASIVKITCLIETETATVFNKHAGDFTDEFNEVMAKFNEFDEGQKERKAKKESNLKDVKEFYEDFLAEMEGTLIKEGDFEKWLKNKKRQ